MVNVTYQQQQNDIIVSVLESRCCYFKLFDEAFNTCQSRAINHSKAGGKLSEKLQSEANAVEINHLPNKLIKINQYYTPSFMYLSGLLLSYANSFYNFLTLSNFSYTNLDFSILPHSL